MKKFLESPFGKGLVAILRNAVIVAAGLILTELPTLISGMEMDPFVRALVIGLIKIVDETLHKTGVAEKGLTRF
jgi:hypothetical protein